MKKEIAMVAGALGVMVVVAGCSRTSNDGPSTTSSRSSSSPASTTGGEGTANHPGSPTRMLTPRQVNSIAVEHMQVGGTGYSWPIPVLEAGTLRLAVLVYRRTRGQRPDVHPPYEAILVDPAARKFVGKRARPMGESVDVDRKLPSPSPRPHRTMEEWSAAEERMNEIAPRVWDAYAARSTDKALRPVVEEYRRLLAFLEMPEIVPAHAVVGRDFNDWMNGIAGTP